MSPVAPALIWGVVMIASLACAAVTVWRTSGLPEQRLIGSGDDSALRRDMARVSAERDALVGRLATLERGAGGIGVARNRVEPVTTGSILKKGDSPGTKFALSLGIEQSLDAAKRRWSELTARFPDQLARLNPRVQREAGATTMLDLVAGPYSSREEANQICGVLAEHGLACDTTEYAGDPLGRL